MDNVTCTNCRADNRTNSKYCRQCGHELPKPKVETAETPIPPTAQPQQDRKKKLIGSIVGIIAFGLAYWGVQQIFFKPPSFDKVVVHMAA